MSSAKLDLLDQLAINPANYGLIHLYDQENRLTAFESGDLEARSTVIFIGGLGDGLCAVPYIDLLAAALEEVNFSLIQVLLSSSYAGFGFGSIEKDAQEIRKLLRYLRTIGKSQFVLLGHSTGCQDIIKLFNTQNDSSNSNSLDGVLAIILQAPVSDREYILDTLGEEAYQKSIQEAQKLVDAGQNNAAVPSEFSDMFSGGRCAISASRWLSLAKSLQDHPAGEDFFSSDLPTELLTANLEPVAKNGVAAMVLISGRDETMPSKVDKELLLKRLVEGLASSSDPDHEHLKPIAESWSVILSGAGHQAEEIKPEICTRIVDFIGAALACLEL
ncbi:hypothetical protein PTTG_27665 [Puccinia triticina 1-1 BBBD Race 1]|uniref:DUF1749-domain-containing protein n=2 Tax=Puccinia triticina TaxID=208348 RepID=A0A180GI12_PUCT1|nr:uncharacterized protein PtA15_5A5 [Puccinia triticina]OAV92387.1 hypothetical protein PTTG_27665 [Puccinia triticina 1-1 BBBD Race 1]WAQ84435.1 hypothetical protein PtA15_5A5 [Puccinia triticina]WAR57777.1 hypothetical protein PtB15_5B7 [Puccinia triticina]